MQEDIEHRSVTLIVNGAKFSGRMLKSAIRAYMGYRKEKHREHKAQKQAKGNVVPRGKMTVKQLAEQNQGMSSFEMQKDDGIRQFERVCRKYGVDYAVRQVKGDIPVDTSAKTESAPSPSGRTTVSLPPRKRISAKNWLRRCWKSVRPT